MRRIGLVVALLALVLAPDALAVTPASVLDGDVPCGEVVAEGNVSSSLGQVWCGSITAADATTATLDPPIPTQPSRSDPVVRSTHDSFDGVPLDVNFALPSVGSPPFPVVGMFHGYGLQRYPFRSMQTWLDRGYAVYSVTQRGFGESCKSSASIAADPSGCANGYVRLMDPRYEVRDTQDFLGELVDQALIRPGRIAAWGASYGGGMAMSLAALKDRTMMPDGRLVPWRSPNGTPMRLAVATPEVPWTELAYAIAPNGNNLDYLADAHYWGRTGVLKESYAQDLVPRGRVAPPGQDPRADVAGWIGLLAAGEPYDSNPAVAAMVREMNTYHSPYGIPHGEAPAPMLISSGFTDDLFPVNEATRFYNRTRAEHPGTPLALFFSTATSGHHRGQNPSNALTSRTALESQWIEYYLKGVGARPPSMVAAYSQTCPSGAPGGGPFVASDWASIAPGEIRLESRAPQTVAAAGGDPAVAAAFNPQGSGDPCARPAGAREPGSATYEFEPAPPGGFTVMGAVTMIARFDLPGDSSQIAARLVDVSPDGTTKMLVERGLWRPSPGFQAFQLFANGWEVEAGHVLRLELLPRDAATASPGAKSNYGRPSDGQQDVTVSLADVRVPVVEEPGALSGLVQAPAPKALPSRPDASLAPGYDAIGAETIAAYGRRASAGGIRVQGKRATAKGRRLRLRLRCPATGAPCSVARLRLSTVPSGPIIAARRDVTVAPRRARKVSIELTRRGRRAVSRRKRLRALVELDGRAAGFVTVRPAP